MVHDSGSSTVSLQEISFSKARISDQVKDILKELVLNQKAGDRIPSEDEIARRLRVSKVTVREALGHLEAQGLLERRRGVYGGSFVAKPTSGKMGEVVMNYYRMGDVTPENLVEFRCALEPSIAELAAQRITAEELEVLKGNIDILEADLKQGKTNRAGALEFHKLVADACHNPLFIHVTKALTLVFEKVLDQMPLGLEDFRDDIEHGKKLYEAFQRRDAGTAREVMFRHFGRLKNMLPVKAAAAEPGKEGR